MQLIHKSRLLQYRDPFGAVAAGSDICFKLKVTGQIKAAQLVYIYGLYSFANGHCRLTRSEADKSLYQATVPMPAQPCLFFYWFEVRTETGLIYYCRDSQDLAGGGLVAAGRPHVLPGDISGPAAWQVTVYNPAFQLPDWLAGAVIYQIFPDRFRRDKDFSPERFAQASLPERLFHNDWSEDVDIEGLPEKGYLATDFFGGSLKGIQEKLTYIRDLGVTVIYLNPIFRALSNHRYDTGDYENIDPLLGTNADFIELCQAAADLGIRIILDGVFSHTGADSRYFNKYGRYDKAGAWQEMTKGEPSAYASWYKFSYKDNKLLYDSWWGFPELPAVDKNDLFYRRYINGPDGIVRRWLRLGAAGWRLDVSDELPDSFIRELRQASLQEKADAILLGEVWEDGSNKISYGSYRDFLLGNTHDMVMGYPFRSALLGFLRGDFAAEQLLHQLESLRENYPPAAFAAAFNLISSHDVKRAITALAGPPDPGNRPKQQKLQLDQPARQKGEALLKLAVFFQMLYPGCPVLYYGDETGMEGYRDPFNRRTYPWGKENKELIAWFAKLGCLRRDWPVLQKGSLLISGQADYLILERSMPGAEHGPCHILALLNRSAAGITTEFQGEKIFLEPYGCLLRADDQTIDLTKEGEIKNV